MTRSEHLRFCKICQKKHFNPKKGIVCILTDEIADFDLRCEYLTPDNGIIQENCKDRSKKPKDKKIRQQRIPEKITGNDIALLLGMTLANAFLIRIIYYFSIGYNNSRSAFISFLITLLSVSIALLLRNKEIKSYSFMGNMKFKLLFTIFLAFIHNTYTIVVGINYLNFGILIFASFLSVFLISIMSYIIVKPVHLILGNILKLNDKII